MSSIKVLSLDGGGIRGIMTLIWLTELEKKIEKPIYEYFDLIIGTSTGSIIACALSSGMHPSTILNMYMKYGADIFDVPKEGSIKYFIYQIKKLFINGLFSPKYSGKGLRDVLKKVFKESTLKSLRRPTLISCYSLKNRKPLIFKSYHDSHKDIPIHKVCKASSSAPTFFPAEVIKIDNEDNHIIDGSVILNNPSLMGVIESLKINDGKCVDNVVLASFGTGESISDISIEESQEWGALEWARPIADVLFDGSSAAVDYICKKFLNNDNYFRFQVVLDEESSEMDNHKSDNINRLCIISQSYLDNGGMDKIDSLVKKLTE
jgi:patatin-like phospholipase/acyl hydrolase